MDVVDPATTRLVAHFHASDLAQVDQACQAAHLAFGAWSSTPSPSRAAYLDAIAKGLEGRKSELSRLSSLVNGKPLFEAQLDLDDAAACFRYYAGLAREIDLVQGVRVPTTAPAFDARLERAAAGVAALITPWNFPFVTAAWKIAPALAAGCTVVWKPSEITVAIERELAVIAEEAGLPGGVLNLAAGGGEVGAALVAHPLVSKISFTGSNRIGSEVMRLAAPAIKTVSLELGGKSPILVLADADLDQAAELVCGGAFFNAGQMCSATSRVLVDQKVAAPLLERILALAGSLAIGPGLAEGTAMGPLTTAPHFNKVRRAIDTGGGRLIQGGRDLQDQLGGYFLSPAIFTEPDLASPLWRDEIFGPVMAIAPFPSEGEAVRLANDSPYGLVASVVSGDEERACKLASRLRVGQVWINMPQVVLPETSWGGFGVSGIGRELGPHGLAAFQEIRHVVRPI